MSEPLPLIYRGEGDAGVHVSLARLLPTCTSHSFYSETLQSPSHVDSGGFSLLMEMIGRVWSYLEIWSKVS